MRKASNVAGGLRFLIGHWVITYRNTAGFIDEFLKWERI